MAHPAHKLGIEQKAGAGNIGNSSKMLDRLRKQVNAEKGKKETQEYFEKAANETGGKENKEDMDQTGQPLVGSGSEAPGVGTGLGVPEMMDTMPDGEVKDSADNLDATQEAF